jgi:hypothetical protein
MWLRRSRVSFFTSHVPVFFTVPRFLWGQWDLRPTILVLFTSHVPQWGSGVDGNSLGTGYTVRGNTKCAKDVSGGFVYGHNEGMVISFLLFPSCPERPRPKGLLRRANESRFGG